MMKLTIDRESLLSPLQLVNGVIERRQTLPILSHVLLQVNGNQLSFTGTDLEIEAKAEITTSKASGNGQTTVSARKLFDICKALPDSSIIEIIEENQSLTVKSGRSRFQLGTLAAKDFPLVSAISKGPNFTIQQNNLLAMLNQTIFAMANQDVRYYLNGMLFEIEPDSLRLVATDGHRLASSCMPIDSIYGFNQSQAQLIIPRKGVLELARNLQNLPSDLAISITFNTNHVAIHYYHEQQAIQFISKLIDGKFPDYQRAISQMGDKQITADRLQLKQALQRVAILSNEKFRGIRLTFSQSQLSITASNPEQEQAEESLAIDYNGPSIEIGFNVSYLLDVLSVISSDIVKIMLQDSDSSALFMDPAVSEAVYVVMPMRL